MYDKYKISWTIRDQLQHSNLRMQQNIILRTLKILWMNYFSEKLYLYSQFGRINQSANSEINAIIYFYIHYKQADPHMTILL